MHGGLENRAGKRFYFWPAESELREGELAGLDERMLFFPGGIRELGKRGKVKVKGTNWTCLVGGQGVGQPAFCSDIAHESREILATRKCSC